MKYFCKKQQIALQHTNMKRNNIIEKLFGGILEEFKVPGKFGEFVFTVNDSLKDVCNIPEGKSCGVYIFTMTQNGKEIPVYIGSSTSRNTKGKNKEGLRGRICTGYQINKLKITREPFFKDEMKKKGINQLKVYWFIFNNLEYPEYIEYRLILKHISHYHELPEYNNELKRKEKKFIKSVPALS